MEEIREMESLINSARLFASSTMSLALAVSKASLPIGVAHLARTAHELAKVTGHPDVSSTALLKAADQLQKADAATRAEAVSELVRESMAFAKDAVLKGHDDLMRRSVDLAIAGRCYLRVADLVNIGEGVEHEHNQESKQQSAANVPWRLRISKWWYKSRSNDVESLLTPSVESVVAMTGRSSSSMPQGKLSFPSEKWLNIQLFTLSTSIALFVYMGPEGVLKNHKDTTTFLPAYLWRVNLIFVYWWGVVFLGVLCSLHGSRWIERQYARLAAYLGMFGPTVLVAMFGYWMLAPEATVVLGIFIVLEFLFFVTSFIRSCNRGDL